MTQTSELPTTVTIGGDLTVGRIGYGAMQLTGPKVWGEYPDHDKGIALLREVVAQGVTFIDTADVYGPHSNEELIREALHPYPDNLVIATKGGFVRGGPEYSDMGAIGNKWYLRQAAYMSMRRLGLDHIDLYYLHTPAFTDVPFEEIVETLAGMKARTDSSATSACPTSAPTSSAPPCRSPTSPPSPSSTTSPSASAPPCDRSPQDEGIVFSPWHPGAIPGGPDGEPFHAVIDPIAATTRRHPAADRAGLAAAPHRHGAADPRHHQHRAPDREPRSGCPAIGAIRGRRHHQPDRRGDRLIGGPPPPPNPRP